MEINITEQLINALDDKIKTHRPLSTKFSLVEVLGDNNILVCEEYYGFHYEGKSNLYCLNSMFEIEWFASFPNPAFKKDDWYVGFAVVGDTVFANSWSGYRVELDLASGKILNTQFTK